MQKLSLRKRFRYHFDNVMARGVWAQVLMLVVLSLVLIIVTALIVHWAALAPADDKGEREGLTGLLWRSLLHTIDTGGVGNDNGSNTYLFMMLFITFGGLFVVSAFIGIVNSGLSEQMLNLRKGRSLVAEKNHTVILGYTAKIHTLLSELAEANANQPRACVVVLGERDKVEMDDEIRRRLPRKMKVVTRSGSPTRIADLQIVNLPTSKSVIVMSPELDADGEPLLPHQADTMVLKTLLAIDKLRGPDKTRYHVVAELRDEKILEVSRMVAGEHAALLLGPPLISRLLVQTGRQTGLSAVFTDLLDFGGSEIYIQPEPGLEGKTFRVALSSYDDTSLIGVLGADDELRLPPAADYVLRAGDQVIAISEDDDTLLLNGRAGTVDASAIAKEVPPFSKRPERNLVLGTSERLLLVLRELAPYCAAGSVTVVVGEEALIGASALAAAPTQFPHLGVSFKHGDISERALLDSLDLGSFDHVLVLSEAGGRTPDIADARTMVTLLHLRDIARKTGATVTVTSEILEIENRELAAVAEADDFVVSNTLVALMATQLAENRHLTRVFDELFTFGGHDVRIKPAANYVVPDREVDFYTVVEAAARRDEIAIGYRLGALARDSTQGFGVFVNPKKHRKVRFGPQDQIVVLAAVD